MTSPGSATGWGHYVSGTPPSTASSANESPLRKQSSGPILNALLTSSSRERLALPVASAVKTLGSPFKVSPSCPNLSAMGSTTRSFGVSPAGPGGRGSLSEATSTLFQLRRSGILSKRGFHWRKKWVSRWVLLRGRMLSYYELNTADGGDLAQLESGLQPRGTLELSSGTIVNESVVDGKSFAFEVVPLPPLKDNIPVRLTDAELDDAADDGHRPSARTSPSLAARPPAATPVSPVWYLQASTDEERRIWMAIIERSILLIRRTESRPTLTGMGSVHDHYKIGQVIGVGRFGVVRAAQNKRTQHECAAKIVNRKKHLTTDLMKKMLENEISLLRLMSRLTETKDHANIMKVHEVYEDNFLIYMVVEMLSGGDLFDHIAGLETFTELGAARIMRGIIAGVSILHEVGIIHRDLKPENFLFKLAPGQAPVVKISDFGLSGTLRQFERQARESGGQRMVVGTPGYIAPEVIDTRMYSTASDIYALGVILYTILVGYPPIAGQKKDDVFRKTLAAEWGFVMADWNDVSSIARGLVGSMLSLKVLDRSIMTECRAHQWVVRGSSGNALVASQARLRAFVEQRKAQTSTKHMSIMATPPSLQASAQADRAGRVGRADVGAYGSLRSNKSTGDIRTLYASRS